MLKKKIWPGVQRIIELFTQKFVSKLYKIWVWDPGSGIRITGIMSPVEWDFAGNSAQSRLVFGSSVIKSAECCQE